MFGFVDRFVLSLRHLRQMTPQQRREAIKRRLAPHFLDRVRKIRETRENLRVAVAQRSRGFAAAHEVLWTGPAAQRGWGVVQNRLSVLTHKNPEQIRPFIEAGLRLNFHPLVLTNLATYPLSASVLGEVLAAERLNPLPEIDAALATRADYAAAFVVATALTGDDAALDHVRARVQDVVGDTMIQMIESYGQRPAATAAEVEPILRGLRRNGLRAPVRHRLVIAENFDDAGAFVPYLAGAERVTLLGLDDTFGKTAFSAYQNLPGVGEVVVEHIRSRITRFSAQYVEAHSQTRDAAIDLAARIAQLPGLVPEGDLAHIELAIADYLFFQLLRLRAVEELIADPDFDHIVVAFNDHVPSSDYALTLAGVDGLTSDPRVELVSLAQTVAQRVKYSEILPALLTGPRPADPVENCLPAPVDVLPQLLQDAQAVARALPDQAVIPREGASSILVAAASSTAYDLSTARYAAALSRDHAVAFVICGGSATRIQRELSQTDAERGAILFRLLRRDYQLGATLFARWMTGQLNAFCIAQGGTSKIAHIIACAPARLVTGVIQSQIMHGLVLDIWFQRMAETKGLPDALVLSASRTPFVSQLAAAARRHGVPSLTLEAHGLNANYARYAKVATDYYGAISDHFRRDAETGFGVPAGRCRVIGTPRIVAAALRDRDAVRNRMASAWRTGFPVRPGGVVSFFSQPSNWAHVSEVWRMVLAVAQALDLEVLLKPHPEETVSRVGQYGAIAVEMQAGDRVQLVRDNLPADIIEASDVVLTGYSAAALDAAVLGRPVICITVGDADYPVDQHLIAGAPLVRSTAELQDALQACLSDPGAAATAYHHFVAAEPQFFEGPDQRLRDFMAEILHAPQIRPVDTMPQHLFLDPPHPIFTV